MLFPDDNQEAAPSNASETLDVAGEPANAAPDADAESSSAGEKPTDTLSIIRDVVDDGKKTADAASPAEGGETGKQPGDPAAEKPKDDENYTDVPFHKHPRFQQLLKDKKASQGDAAQYRNVQNFMETNGISADEAAEGFIIMGLMKTNPAAAWERMKPTVQKLLIAAGEVLPDDLKTRVEKGELTPDAAFEISRSKAQLNSVTHAQTFEQQRRERTQQTERENSLYTAASDWEADRQAKDPNFAAKVPQLMREVAFLQRQEGKPDTPEGVKDQLKRAYASIVPPPVAKPAPPRPNTRPSSMSGQKSGNQSAAPETMLDIIRANRRAT
jgi:hypothetical protein